MCGVQACAARRSLAARRSPARSPHARRRRRRSRGAGRGGRGAAQADAPAALADLELAEAGRAELGDQGRQQLLGQAVDGGVVGGALVGVGSPASWRRMRRDELGRDRALARPPRGPAGRRATSRLDAARGPPAGIEQVAQAIRQAPVDAAGRPRVGRPQCRRPAPGSVGSAGRPARRSSGPSRASSRSTMIACSRRRSRPARRGRPRPARARRCRRRRGRAGRPRTCASPARRGRRLVGGPPQDRGAALRADDRVDRVLEGDDDVADGDRERPAGAALAGDDRDDRRPQPAHQPDRAGDRLGDAALLGLRAGMGAGHVDEGDDRQAEPLGELHDPHRLAVALGVGHAEVAPDVLVGVGALLLADDDDPPAVDPGEARRRSPRRRRTAGRRGARRTRRPSPRRTRACAGRRRLRASWTRAQTSSRAVGRGGRELAPRHPGRPPGPWPAAPSASSSSDGRVPSPFASSPTRSGERREERQRPERRHVRRPARAASDAPRAGSSAQDACQLVAQLGAGDDPVDEAVREQELGALEALAAAPRRSSRRRRARRRTRSARPARRC